MKLKWFCASMVMALLFGITAAHADGVAPTLASDKGDYAPYETVFLTATGFLPGEEVDLSISIENPETGEVVADYAWTVEAADAEGGILTTYEVPPEAAWMTLHATAIGLQSQLVATHTFTDAPKPPPPPTPQVASSSITAGADTITVSVTWTLPVTGVTAHIVGLAGGFDESLSSSDGKTWTATILVDCNSPYSLQAVKCNEVNGAQAINKSATTDACPVTVVCIANSAPVLHINAATLNLGSVVGCLQGGQLVKTVSVSPASFGATATDVDSPDGTAEVVLSVDSVTLVGPGLASVSLSVTAIDYLPDNDESCPVEDPQDQTAPVKVTATIGYTVNGFLSPLSTTTATVVKLGSTVPVKFRLSDCSGNEITTNLGTDHTIEVLYCSAACPDGVPTVTDAGASNSNGVAFRYSLTDGWIYNLQTKTGYSKGCTYKIRATLNSGQTITSLITIK